MKVANFLTILVFYSLSSPLSAQTKIGRTIQLDSSKAIATRCRVESVITTPAPQKTPVPGMILFPRTEKKISHYQILMIEHGIETLLDEVEDIQIADLKSGSDAPFSLLNASLIDANKAVYLYNLRDRVYLGTAEKTPNGAFHKVNAVLLVSENWQKADFKKENGGLKIYLGGETARSGKIFEQDASGNFTLKSQ